MVRIKAIAGITALVLLCVLLGESAYTVHVLRPKATETMSTLNDTTADVRDYVKFQTNDLQSERTQKLISHSLQIGEAGLSTVQKLNRTTIPAFTGVANELTARLHALEPLETGLAAFVAHLDEQVTLGILPETKALLTKLGLTTDDIRTSIKIAFDQAILSLEDIHKLAADPNWQKILVNVAEGTAHISGTTEQVEIASRNLPQIAANLAKIAKSGATFNKLIGIARILSLLVPLL